MPQQPTIFSGIQPTGNLHLGNYLGAITQWVELQKRYRCIFCVVDYHALTVKQDPRQLHQQILHTAKTYLAAGIDPKRSLIFQQSDIPEHTELAWLLNCAAARISDLNKMTQFKDKAGNNLNVSVGLFDYPVLMAADILLYQTDLVPVGEDQKQHVELTRALARRFNHDYQPVFKVPEVRVRPTGARIMGLDDATKKMSKSAAPANYLALSDTPEIGRKKIMKAQTDSLNSIKYGPQQPAVSNLLTIYSLLSGRTVKELESGYAHQGYGQFKADLANVVGAFLQKFQDKLDSISDRQARAVLDDSARQLQPLARKTVQAVKKALGV